MKLQGIIPPVVTPMTTDQEVDLPGLRKHIDLMLARGVHGIFVLGTTGEFYALDEHEKQQVVAAAIAHVGGRSPVFAGTGAETTREVIRLTKMAEKEGAAGVSVITPYFIKPNQAELFDHFRRIAESTALPVVLYNNPATCGGLSIEPETVARLAEVPNIIGIKDSSGDLQNTIEIIRQTPRDTFSVLNGRDTLILAALQTGAQGAIPASCNIAPELCVGIYESFVKGDVESAKVFQSRLHGVRMAMSLGTGNSAVKEAMALLGRSAGPMRSPVAPFSEAQKAKLKAILEKADLLG
ncbi:dihydrodipicolinate synthase : 4-hydroxy-tetrahydrodipicolinate synthase OS=Pelosinus fermentans JBW45 GN=dapA PE=3 SV=1: DHDPS [Gemmata massiliana]|uniref:4-hydroxy-tetrahydrodipicolinate synthase n=1 Tax=Gemmata massiliana TaxID=1210884 RepID=A0A6P2D2I8_9BACT|nr:4-hydroxy-tetrahydrodipicolinate synthase [Gemmata massiliana]VTR94605.1 dihydrodipicolinate synthase : 4-hydroxy-tetrahydrodipicolinate synthase OS=Pelosinus fermentans JBW45 GN=dapA PE=3 SV=1: DHDPS [Gemmata massiliana]